MIALWIVAVLAFIQGVLEWLPVSSEGQLVLILTWIGESENALAIALFMHIGTLIAVIIRFRADIFLLLGIRKKTKTAEEISEKNTDAKEDPKETNESVNDQGYTEQEKQKILWKFILLATLATAVIGIPLYLLVKFALQEGELLEFANGAVSGGDLITILIGVFLIGTGLFILYSRKQTTRKSLYEMTTIEMLIVGAIQGLAIIPGVSRSGSTVGAMLVEGIEEEDTLRGSFLLSIPAVIGANILTLIIDLIQGDASFADIPWYGMIMAVVISGVTGYITIDLFLRLAKKINFGWFCITFGALALVITLIMIILAVTTA